MKYILIVFALLIIASCQKYLDKKSSTGITVPETLSDLQALLDNSVIMNRQVTPSIGEASADDYFITQATFNSRNELLQDLYKWKPNPNDEYPNDWSYNYKPVYTANYCLETLENIPRTDQNISEWNSIRGAAFFYRSYYFLQLVWTYSLAYDEASAKNDLGIAVRLTSDFNTVSTRSNVMDTYKQIILDANDAAKLLPDLSTHPLRPSKAAAFGLLARVYLSMREYNSAAQYAGRCLEIKNTLMDYNNDPQVNGNASGTTNPFSTFNKEIIFYTEASLTAGSLIGSTNGLIDTTLYRSYQNNDRRRRLFFANASGGFQRFRGHYSVNTRMFTGLATDEIYLIYAESLARSGKSQEALSILNKLLKNRYDATYVPIISTEKSVLIPIILKERRKELLMRGLRFADVKRLNKEGSNILMKRIVGADTISLNPDDKRYALPLPQEVIVQSGMVQNPY